MQFDIAILDPPYRKGMHEKLLPLLAEHMADNGIVICEHETGLEMPQSVGVLEQKKAEKVRCYYSHHLHLQKGLKYIWNELRFVREALIPLQWDIWILSPVHRSCSIR